MHLQRSDLGFFSQLGEMQIDVEILFKQLQQRHYGLHQFAQALAGFIPAAGADLGQRVIDADRQTAEAANR